MTIQKAIKILKMEMLGDSEQMKYAKQIAIEGLEKQIPKKPVTSIHSRTKYIAYVCPVCKKRIISNIGGDWIAGHFQNHCDECGQALDWEGLKENEYRNS